MIQEIMIQEMCRCGSPRPIGLAMCFKCLAAEMTVDKDLRGVYTGKQYVRDENGVIREPDGTAL